jgi:hypothetical protein
VERIHQKSHDTLDIIRRAYSQAPFSPAVTRRGFVCYSVADVSYKPFHNQEGTTWKTENWVSRKPRR